MFYNQLIELCDKNNEKPSVLLKQLGFSYGNLKNWKNGAKVNSDILISISRYFNVSVDYLLGLDNEQNVKEKSPSSNLTDEELELLDKFRHLLEIDKGRILERMETIYAGYSPEQKENVS